MGRRNRTAARLAKRADKPGSLEALGLGTLEAGSIRFDLARYWSAQRTHLVNPDMAAAAEIWPVWKPESDGGPSEGEP